MTRRPPQQVLSALCGFRNNCMAQYNTVTVTVTAARHSLRLCSAFTPMHTLHNYAAYSHSQPHETCQLGATELGLVQERPLLS